MGCQTRRIVEIGKQLVGLGANGARVLVVLGQTVCGDGAHNGARLSRRAFMTTDTELAAMAAPAKIGDNTLF